MATETKTFYPGEYEDATDLYSSITNPTAPVGKGSTNTTYAKIPVKAGGGYVCWPFDTSIIPTNATIDSVTCTAKGSISVSSNVSGNMRLYAGTVAKGSPVSMGTTATVVNITPGTWTRAELSDIRLRTEITYSTMANRYISFYGADLTVTFTYQSEKFMLKLGSEPVKLPAGYTRLAYIESTGTQYVDTGFTPDNNTRVLMELSGIYYESGAAAQAPFGSRTSSSATDRYIFIMPTGGAYRSDLGNAGVSFNASVQYTDKFVVDKNRTVTSLNGEVSVTNADYEFEGTYPMYLFSMNQAGSAYNLTRAMKLYSCKIYDDGTLVRDYVPCTNASGVAGLYDIVNGVFYGSAASTPFVAGPEYNDVWHDVARTFKKVSGIWVEQESLEGVVDTSKKLVNGGEIN